MTSDHTCGRWLWVVRVYSLVYTQCMISYTPGDQLDVTSCHWHHPSWQGPRDTGFYFKHEPGGPCPTLFCVRSQVVMGTLALIPSSPAWLLVESRQYSQFTTCVRHPGPKPENIQPDTPISDDSERCAHPEPFLWLTQGRSFWEACQNVNSDS